MKIQSMRSIYGRGTTSLFLFLCLSFTIDLRLSFDLMWLLTTPCWQYRHAKTDGAEIDWSDLRLETARDPDASLLGKGTTGKVYKMKWMSAGGLLVAVKIFNDQSEFAQRWTSQAHRSRPGNMTHRHRSNIRIVQTEEKPTRWRHTRWAAPLAQESCVRAPASPTFA